MWREEFPIFCSHPYRCIWVHFPILLETNVGETQLGSRHQWWESVALKAFLGSTISSLMMNSTRMLSTNSVWLQGGTVVVDNAEGSLLNGGMCWNPLQSGNTQVESLRKGDKSRNHYIYYYFTYLIVSSDHFYFRREVWHHKINKLGKWVIIHPLKSRAIWHTTDGNLARISVCLSKQGIWKC